LFYQFYNPTYYIVYWVVIFVFLGIAVAVSVERGIFYTDHDGFAHYWELCSPMVLIMDILTSRFKIDDHFIEKIESKFVVRSFKGGEVIFSQGDPDASLYVIKSGQVKLTTHYNASYGVESAFLDIVAKSAIGALSFLDGDIHKASAVAICDTDVIEITQADFVEINKSDPELADSILRLAIMALQKMVSKLIVKFQEQEIMLRGHIK